MKAEFQSFSCGSKQWSQRPGRRRRRASALCSVQPDAWLASEAVCMSQVLAILLSVALLFFLSPVPASEFLTLRTDYLEVLCDHVKHPTGFGVNSLFILLK